MHTCAVSDSLIRVDALVEFFPIEEVLQELLDLGDPGGATNQDKVVDLILIHFGVPESYLNRLECSTEEVTTQFFKPGTCDGRIVVDAFEERVNLDALRKRERTKHYFFKPIPTNHLRGGQQKLHLAI